MNPSRSSSTAEAAADFSVVSVAMPLAASRATTRLVVFFSAAATHERSSAATGKETCQSPLRASNPSFASLPADVSSESSSNRQ